MERCSSTGRVLFLKYLQGLPPDLKCKTLVKKSTSGYRKFPNKGAGPGGKILHPLSSWFLQKENRTIFGWDMAKIEQKLSMLRVKRGESALIRGGALIWEFTSDWDDFSREETMSPLICKFFNVTALELHLLSPPMHIARWAHMHHFLSVCLSVTGS